MRSALKLTLRSYECLGSASSVFDAYRSSHVYTVYLRLKFHDADVVALLKEIIMIK